jgi:hypothetical protein
MASPSQPVAHAIAQQTKPVSPHAMVIAWSLAAIAVLLQMLTNGRYGYFPDELYFIATSKHLAFGYVDFAPLAAVFYSESSTQLVSGNGRQSSRSGNCLC